VGPGSFSG